MSYLPYSSMLAALLAGGAAGAGARTIKQVSDMWQEKDIKPPVDLPKATTSRVPVSVRVSPQEAAELESQGMKVRRMPAKLGSWGTDPGLLGTMAMGGLAVGGAYAGWKALDKPLDEDRKSLAKAKLDAVRKRVEMLMSDQPQHPDAALHGYMKGAEEAYFGGQTKTAILGSLLNTIAPLGYPLGALGVILAASAYNNAQGTNKNEQSVKALKSHYMHRSTTPPEAELEPVMVEEDPAMLGPKVAAALKKRKKLDHSAIGKSLSAGKDFKASLTGVVPA